VPRDDEAEEWAIRQIQPIINRATDNPGCLPEPVIRLCQAIVRILERRRPPAKPASRRSTGG
jgi:hypothetical protein